VHVLRLLFFLLMIYSIQAALTLTAGLLQHSKLGLQMPGIAQLYGSVLVPAVQSIEPEIRALAIRGMGIYCTHRIEHAASHTLLFATVLNNDVPVVALEATMALLDLCCVFGRSLVEQLETQALQELAKGPQLSGEPNCMLARVLAPMEGREDADSQLEDVVWIGVAKMLLHDRLHSPPLLGRVLAKAATGHATMTHFVRTYESHLPKISVQRLRGAVKYAARLLRGADEGVTLRQLATQVSFRF
jgi:hypothetical protein